MEWWCRMKLRFVRWKRMKNKIKLENLEIAFFVPFLLLLLLLLLPRLTRQNEVNKNAGNKKMLNVQIKKYLWGNFCSFSRLKNVRLRLCQFTHAQNAQISFSYYYFFVLIDFNTNLFKLTTVECCFLIYFLVIIRFVFKVSIAIYMHNLFCKVNNEYFYCSLFFLYEFLLEFLGWNLSRFDQF